MYYICFIVLRAGERPRKSKGTKVSLLLSDKDPPREWGARSLVRDGTTLTVRVFTPPTCYVAKWSFHFDTVLQKGESSKVFRYTHPQQIYMIFNPWCTGQCDSLYL